MIEEQIISASNIVHYSHVHVDFVSVFLSYVFGLFGNGDDGKIHFKEFLQIIDFPNQGTLDERLKLAFHM